MCVSGFVSYKPDIKWQTVQKRFRQLIIPFLAWVAVSCCVHLDPTLFLAKVVHPDSGLWFLWTLFFIVLLMWLCNWIVTCLKVKIEYVVCFFSLLMMGIMVALKFKLFGFQFIARYFPFYAIGFFGRKYQYLWEKRGRVDSLWFSALFLCMAYLVDAERPSFVHAPKQPCGVQLCVQIYGRRSGDSCVHPLIQVLCE